MALKPEYGVMAGLAVGAVVFAVHAQATPTMADIQALPAGLDDIDSAERKATFISAGVVAGISLLAKDPTIFVIGSAMTVAMALWTRHANYTESVGGRFMDPATAAAAGTDNTGPEMETKPYEMFTSSSDFDR